MVLFMTLLIFSIIFWLVYRSRKAKNKSLPKRFLIPFFSVALLFVLSAGAIDTSMGDEDKTRLIQEKTKLTEQLESMDKAQSEMKESLKQLESDLKSEQEMNEEFEKKIEVLSENEKESEEKIIKLEKENKELEERVAAKKIEDEKIAAKKEEEKKIAAKKKDEEARVAQATKKENEVKAAATSEQDSEKVSPKTSSAPSNDVSNDGDCDIKGSQTGIYHVPGSTYYSRTTNVVQWFCSTEEAESAGYRAPER